MRRVVLAVLIAALTAGSCGTVRSAGQAGNCGGRLDRGWRRLESPPGNASTLRTIAEANRLCATCESGAVEQWYAQSSGQQMLCRFGDARWSCGGEWWAFVPSPKGPVIVRHEGWVCVS